jgi:deazaflavin-dependent oxidoreductase (nitroreductase family)
MTMQTVTTATPAKEEQQDLNHFVITEFRANGGQVGGPVADLPLLLVTTRGAKSGRPITTPVTYIRDGGRLVITANKSEDATTHPDWFYNLLAMPEVTVELGAESFAARGIVLEGAERERLFTRIAAAVPPRFAGFFRNAHHPIPVIALERQAS